MNKKKNYEDLIWLGGLFLYSILVFFILLLNKANVFIADDNAMQWSPVVRSAFDSLFEGKGLPYWNFYQYKGLDIFSSGYYGFTNPFMYISYMISRFIFSYSVNTLEIYMWLLYWLGLFFMYLVLKDMKISRPAIIVSLAAYSSAIIYFIYGYYYFEFNCFFILPLLIWVMLRSHGKKGEWFIPGMILAFSMLMGHVQYSCYFVMVYLILMVVMSVSEKKISLLGRACANIGVFFLLSALILFLSVAVSQNRSTIIAFGGDNEFFRYPVQLEDLINIIPIDFYYGDLVFNDYYQRNLGAGIFVFLPVILFIPFFRKVFDRYQSFHNRVFTNKNDHMRTISILVLFFITIVSYSIIFARYIEYMFSAEKDPIVTFIIIPFAATVIVSLIYGIAHRSLSFSASFARAVFYLALVAVFLMMPPTAVYLIAVVYYLVCIFRSGSKDQEKDLKKWICSIMFAAYFFIVYSMGEEYGIAFILSKVPLISSFRYLYKGAFIFLPLLIMIGAYSLDRLKKSKKWIYIVSICLSVVYIASMYQITHGLTHRYINNPYFAYNACQDDEELITEQIKIHGIDHNYRVVTVGDEDYYQQFDPHGVDYSSHISEYTFTKNFATKYRLYSINGYDNIFSIKGFDATDHIMADMYFEAMYNNTITKPGEMAAEVIDDKAYIGEFEKQWIESGIRYLLVPHEGKNSDAFLKIFDKCSQLAVTSREEWLYDYDIVEISGTRPICSYDGDKKLDMDSRMDSISFDTDFASPTAVDISMTYDPGYRMSLTDKTTGQISDVELSADDMGYTNVTIPAGSYTAKLYYKNNMMTVTLVVSIITVILSVGAVIYVYRKYEV